MMTETATKEARKSVHDPVIPLFNEAVSLTDFYEDNAEAFEKGEAQNHKKIINKMYRCDKKLLDTPAESLEGLLLQVKYIAEYLDGWDNQSLFKNIQASIENIMNQRAA